jgi:hypothetical protein
MLIGNENPLRFRVGRHCLGQMCGKIFLRPRWPHGGGEDGSGGDLEMGHSALGTVANIFIFLALKAACAVGGRGL